MKKKITRAVCLHFLLAIGILISPFAEAQIFYTDIPDVTLKCSKNVCLKSFLLDLDNNGIADLSIEVQSTQRQSAKCGKRPCPSYENLCYVKTVADNRTLHYPSDGYPGALMEGSEINSFSNWNRNEFLPYPILREYMVGCFWACGTHVTHGEWYTTSDRYLGVKIVAGGQDYYGWIRLSVSVSADQSSCIIKDYAYQSTAGAGILAGNTGALTTSRSSNINNQKEEQTKRLEIKIIPNPVSSSSQISFTLSKPGKVSIDLYDITGRLVKTISDKTFNEGTHQINLDTKDLVADIYLVRLQLEEIIETKKIVVIK